MTDSLLSITERQVGDVIILALAGQMVLDDGDLVFGRHVSNLVDQGHIKVVLDLREVTYIDSSGVGMMAAKLKRIREKGGDIRLQHLTGRSQRLFTTLKLITAFEIFDDEEAAVRSYAYRPHA